jgi:ribose-phosphate pyrophosphokinase
MASKLYTIVAGPHGESFARALARSSGAKLILAEHKIFPDGEHYFRLPEPIDTAVAAIVVSMYPSQNDALIESLLLAEASLGAGAKSVVLVAPYLAYTRQDRRFLSGEPVSVRALLRALYGAGFRGLVTVDVHKEDSLRDFPGIAVNVDPSAAFAEYLRRLGFTGSDTVVVGPDRGALVRARRLGEKLGCQYDYLDKFRDRVTGEITYRPKHVEVKGKRVVIVDDIISTGGTLAKAARILYEVGAKEVVAVCSHGLFVKGAADKLRSAGLKRVAVANTVPISVEGVDVIDVSGLVVRYLDYVVERL